ncbi:TPA: MerR family transcriptional regulator [Bacillus cereus]|uniref:MerR family transcriptional regulator n=2 Tax=Bacillus cereus group TaxID=86661 RepID=UPI0011A9756A|nr:MerR family transcriptional regulator [Bacillus thuringiensis]MCU5606879.1 helix-turn-helix domain-containing protein [Bacillus cereus]HDR8261937.1 MerR family transcriptional regulator [Bacillus cereus]HDR8267233.1 MerR family transcriptional regulator [Bacillus cereus]HDR8272431.1 MerR family transcriptional regulator [Bacillus cereus]HDR8277975.1 MerR family transcriptional regulator [Bacillus cereus]
MEQTLLTISQIAKELQIPESTARYYRDRFINYIPFVGKGRAKKYRPETVEILRFIAEGFNRNLTAMEIEDGLSRMVARNVEVEEETATTIAAAQQQWEDRGIPIQVEVGEKFQQMMNQFTLAMEVIADQKQEIAELRKTVGELQDKQKEQEKQIESKLKLSDEKLIEVIKEIQETKEQIETTESSSWWRRLWGNR